VERSAATRCGLRGVRPRPRQPHSAGRFRATETSENRVTARSRDDILPPPVRAAMATTTSGGHRLRSSLALHDDELCVVQAGVSPLGVSHGRKERNPHRDDLRFLSAGHRPAPGRRRGAGFGSVAGIGPGVLRRGRGLGRPAAPPAALPACGGRELSPQEVAGRTRCVRNDGARERGPASRACWNATG
jgi:hypothetical protein